MYDWVLVSLISGGSANGDRLSSVGSMGEYTAVASAKRGVLGTLSDVSDAMLDLVVSLVKGVGRLFSLSAEER
jgi:hypothetical protein